MVRFKALSLKVALEAFQKQSNGLPFVQPSEAINSLVEPVRKFAYIVVFAAGSFPEGVSGVLLVSALR